jgi:hypothetical protein
MKIQMTETEKKLFNEKNIEIARQIFAVFSTIPQDLRVVWLSNNVLLTSWINARCPEKIYSDFLNATVAIKNKNL